MLRDSIEMEDSVKGLKEKQAKRLTEYIFENLKMIDGEFLKKMWFDVQGNLLCFEIESFFCGFSLIFF